MASLETRHHGTGRTTYRVVWWENGVRQPAMTFANPDEALRFKMLVEGSGNRWPAGWVRPNKPGPPPKPTVLTFGTWARTAVDSRSRANERTKADYRRDLERHFKLLEDVPLADLTTEHVAQWERDRRAVPLADKTIRNLHGFASSIMADALSQHPPIAAHNPFANRLAKHTTVRTEEMVFFTPPEFALILRHMPDERNYRELARLLYGLGPRFGEATALDVRDVELLGRRKALTITKAWKRTGTSDYQRGEPKTPKARRTLSLPAALVDLLVPLVASRKGHELLFPGAGGGRLPHTEFYKRAWAPAVARANVCDTHYAQQRDGRGNPPRMPDPCDCAGVLGKRPRIHDIRHSWVANQIAEGVPLEVISRRAGHSSITITMDRYGHLDPRFDALVDAAADRALASF